MNPRLRAYLLLLIVTFIWGMAGPVIKLTLRALPADVFLLYRFFISSLIALIFFLAFGLKIPKDKKTLLLTMIYGLLTSTVTLGLLFWGTAKTSLLDMSLIQSLGPLAVILAGYYFLKEHISTKEKIGILIAFIGSALIVLEPLIKNSQSKGQLLGNVLILASLLTNAGSVVILKRLLQNKVDPLALANLSFVIGFFTLLPFVLLNHQSSIIKLISVPLPYHLGVFYMAVFSGTIAYALSNLAQKSIEVSEAALFSYLYPIFSAILAIIWLKEIPTIFFLIGSVVIASGVVLAEMRRKLL